MSFLFNLVFMLFVIVIHYSTFFILMAFSIYGIFAFEFSVFKLLVD